MGEDGTGRRARVARHRVGGKTEAEMGAQWKQKHRENAAAAKGRVFSKLSKEITIAARDGADPSSNARLRMAIEAAKKASMTRETLDRAIKKGAGLTGGDVQYETVTYEGFAPHQVPVIVVCLTDNRNRTASNVRVIFNKGDGQLAATGTVSWDFDRLGSVEGTHASEVDPETEAIEAGAQELEPADGGGTVFYTEPGDLDAVRVALEARGWEVSDASLIWKAKNPVELDDAAREEVEAFLGALDDDDDVQHLFVGLGG